MKPPSHPFKGLSNSTASSLVANDFKIHCVYQDEKTVLLQTARAVATNDETQTNTGIRILFDNGSQHSYVTENICTRLRLRPIHSERIQVNTFGGEQFKTKQCKMVKFTLHRPAPSEHLSLTAVSYPAICSTLPSITGVNNYTHLAVGVD